MPERDRPDLDLGDGHTLRFVAFAPDRALNPHLADIPDDEKAGAIVTHGTNCQGYLAFNPRVSAGSSHWTVESWEPLTISPSVLCAACGDHGFIRGGKWVRA